MENNMQEAFFIKLDTWKNKSKEDLKNVTDMFYTSLTKKNLLEDFLKKFKESYAKKVMKISEIPNFTTGNGWLTPFDKGYDFNAEEKERKLKKMEEVKEDELMFAQKFAEIKEKEKLEMMNKWLLSNGGITWPEKFENDVSMSENDVSMSENDVSMSGGRKRRKTRKSRRKKSRKSRRRRKKRKTKKKRRRKKRRK
tara:strand:- start:85 stop:672 length:588 start_codon:yes stop_codon:yes gene_type:complete